MNQIKKKKKVLVIDDDSDIRKLLGMVLEKNNYEVILAQDGEEGYNLAIKENPDLIVLDVIMPGKDGYTICRQIRNTESIKEIPIIMLTVKQKTKEIIDAFVIGTTDFLSKPFDTKVLLERIKELIG